MNGVREMGWVRYRFAVGYVVLMGTLYAVVEVGSGAAEDSWVGWLMYPFYVLLLPAGVPVFIVAVVASALLGGYIADPRSELVAPVAIAVAVLLNALMIHGLFAARDRHRSFRSEPQGAVQRHDA